MTATLTQLSVVEFLEFERASEERHEFIDGEVVKMVGASLNHARILTKLVRLLDESVTGLEAEVFSQTLRVRIPGTTDYCYPDIAIVIGTPKLEDSHHDTLLNPDILIEVLSPSTEAFDRGRKFAMYRRIPSLREYILVSQDEVLVDRMVRGDDGWRVPEPLESLDDTVQVHPDSKPIRLADIYERVINTSVT